MTESAPFQRARSSEAKAVRERAILDAARTLAAERSIRAITLTDIAEKVGMHKSALLRYFETREEIFLRVTATEWTSWADELVVRLQRGGSRSSQDVAAELAATLARRGTFCDLLAQAPLNLERNVSVEAVRRFKLVTHEQLDRIVAAMREALPRLTAEQGVDIIAAATAMAGAFWQIATPGPEVAELYRADPLLGHAVFDIEPRLQRMIAAMLRGFAG